MNDTVSKNTTMSIVATALLGFSGILSETSMNVTFLPYKKFITCHCQVSNGLQPTTFKLLQYQ